MFVKSAAKAALDDPGVSCFTPEFAMRIPAIKDDR